MNKKQFSIQLCFDLASMISQFQIKNNKVRGLILSLDAAFIFQKIIKCMLRYVILIYFTVDSRVFGPKILWIRLCYPRIMIDYWAHTLSKVVFSPRVTIMCGFPQIVRVLDPLVGKKNWCAGVRVLT